MTDRPTIIFDVNETLLDLSALDPLFVDAFGDKATRRVWFAQMLGLAMSSTIVGAYAPFDEIALAALEMTARKRGVALDRERKRRILGGMAALPPHGDVADGLRRLQEAGFRLAVLSNSTERVVREQLEHARLLAFFSHVISVDAVGRFKPAPETYAHAASVLEAAPQNCILVAAHDWDIAGAMRADFRAAFVSRHGTALNPLAPAPEIVAPTVRDIAEAIVMLGSSSTAPA